MADRHILYKLQPAVQGNKIADALDIETDATYVGALSGVTDVQTGLRRIDGTGVGAVIFSFTGNYTAQASNIAEWFNDRQLSRMRCTDDGGTGNPTFTLPSDSDLTTAFDDLVTLGLAEVITFVIEYTDTSGFLRIVPPSGKTIAGTSVIIVRPNVAATVEVTRTSGTISDYIWRSIGEIGGTGSTAFDAIKLIDPQNATWDASASGNLPTTGVVKGNAYNVVNAPADGSGRFGEVMETDDWVVWDAETFTSWSATPHQWFVLPAHEVRRISALQSNFLGFTNVSTPSDRNTYTRGANYADSAGEIRLKIYATRAAYSAADLNTTGDIDEYSDASDQDGFLGIRLSGTNATVAATLPSLWVYAEDAAGNFVRLLNLQDDFTFEGDFGAESDYLSSEPISYATGSTLRIYFATINNRYNNPRLDISEDNLTTAVQNKLNAHSDGGIVDQRLDTLESKMTTLFPLSPDVTDLTEWADIWQPDRAASEVDITDGYSLIADYRGSGTRYESAGVTYDDTGTNVVTYTGLGDNLYRTFGFKVTAAANQVLMWLVDGSTRIPFIDMTSAGKFRINSYTNETAEDQVITNQAHFLTRSGDTTLRPGTDDTSTYTITAFPANATNTSRFLDFETDILVNGTDTLAGHLFSVSLPADNTAQGRQTVSGTGNLGPLYGNRQIPITIAYELRVSGGDLLVDLQLVSAPSDVTIQLASVSTLLNYTAPGATTRVDNYVVFNDGGGDYTFTGENELLVTFQPHSSLGFNTAVGAAIGTSGAATEFNDINVPINAHIFESVEIPDQTALSGFEFRTFSPDHYLIHRDVANLVTRRATQWCYGLALNRAITEHAVTSVVDFTSGIILTSPDSTRWLLEVDNSGTLKTTSQ